MYQLSDRNSCESAMSLKLRIVRLYKSMVKKAAPFVVGRKQWVLLSGLVATLIATSVISLGTGAVSIPFSVVIDIVFGTNVSPLNDMFTLSEEAIINRIRMPRVLMGILVGGCLAICGAALQGLFRNPLADPALIGVSSGAALGAVSVIVLSQTVLLRTQQLLGSLLLPLGAFVGGMLMTLIVYRLASAGGRSSVSTLLLAGIAVGSLCGAGTGLLTYMADDLQLRTLTFWTMGSLGGATWSKLGVSAIFMFAVMVIIPFYAKALNALLLGESEATHLGFDLKQTKRELIVLIALGVGAAVSVSGIIGFVGLITPHLVRLVVGPDHRILLPASALVGAILLLMADLFARTIVAPSELPIGIVTTLIGGPFFIGLLLRFRASSGNL